MNKTKWDYSKGNDRAYIVCAACKIGEIIFAGARHWDSVMLTQKRALTAAGNALGPGHPELQGFIDQFGNFYDRKEALALCIRDDRVVDYAGQGGCTDELYSEGLY